VTPKEWDIVLRVSSLINPRLGFLSHANSLITWNKGEHVKAMKFGVCIPNYGETSTVEGLKDMALEAEKLGYDSLWATDHVLMPENSGTPYERIFETLTTLAYLSGITTKVKLGISSLIIAMRNPVVAAKQLATVDALSGGRLMLCVSSGWNKTEYANLGENFNTRGKRLNDTIRLIRALWNGENSFRGKYIPQTFSNVVFEPKPVSRELSIWIGGTSKAAMKRAVNLGDGWHPNALPLDTFKDLVNDFKNIPGAESKIISVRIGLNIKEKESTYTGPQGERRILLSGDLQEDKSIISQLKELGVSYMLVVTNPSGRVSFSDQLNSLRVFAKEIMPAT
jgi:probable F420-dependent oxidoreductase